MEEDSAAVVSGEVEYRLQAGRGVVVGNFAVVGGWVAGWKRPMEV